MLFVSPLIAFPAWGFIHIEHHRHTNDDERDPDHFASHGPWWQLPVRFAAMDVPYVGFYVRNLKRRPIGPRWLETGALLALTVAVVATTLITGSFWLLAVIYLIPERIAIAVLGWWFDWLPHHGLEDTQTENRYRATRNRVGLEWLFTPLMLSQNYHLVHHLHPSVPFYRYVKTWRRNEEAYLERDAAISTAFGRSLNADEFREWKQLNRKLLKVLPVRMPTGVERSARRVSPAAGRVRRPDHRRQHAGHLRGARGAARPVPLRARTARDRPHRPRRARASGATTRSARPRPGRCCGSPSSTSPVARSRRSSPSSSQPGDVLEVMTPTGRFCTPLHPLNQKHYVALAVGSGITPILSMLQTTLELETDSRFTLIYGNRTKDSTMFRAELDELESRYADRLEILPRPLARPAPHPRPARPDRPREARTVAGGRTHTRRPSTSGSCAARSSSRRSFARR